MSVFFERCQMDYCNFTGAKATKITMDNCSMRENAFIRFKWKEWQLEKCDVCRWEVADTSLKGLDMTGCTLSGWMTDLFALRGLKVTKEQAVIFAGLLGLDIIDL